MQNFIRPKNEQPKYYASTVEDGKIIKHDGEPEYAVYKSEMDETERRANLWHNWVDKNVANAYDGLGIMDDRIYYKFSAIREQFMNGEREE
jgi:hypothetical protein